MQQEEKIRQLVSSEAIPQHSLRDRVGITIEATNARDAITKIREAEQAGVQQVWSSCFIGSTDALTTFAAVAVQTERIRLGTAIMPTYPRHPLVMAQQALAVHDLAPGRLRLGVGPGGLLVVENWYGLKLSSPLPYLKDYVQALRSTLWEGGTNYQGKFFQAAFPMSRPAHVPLLISALGLKAFRLAGEIADGAIAGACPIPYLLESALPALRAGAEARNRPAPPLIGHVLVALNIDEAAVSARARQLMHMFAQSSTFFAQMFAQAGFPRAVDGDETELDALARTVVISGDEATVRNRVQELLAHGLDELILQPLTIADEEKERTALLHLAGSL